MNRSFQNWMQRAWLLLLPLAPATAQVTESPFEAETIDARVEIGYGLAVGDVDGDGRTDLLLADKSDIVWYENPGQRGMSWPRHVMAHQLTRYDHVCIAARDLNGDGRVEVAVGANWNPSETTDRTQSGAVFYLQRPADPRQRWNAIPLEPFDPTVHRMHFVKWSTPQDFRLLVLPLHGVGNQNGQGEPVRLMAYHIPIDHPDQTTAEVVYSGNHMTHNFDVQPLADGREQIWMTSREGLLRIDSAGAESVVSVPPSLGAGEVRWFPWGERVGLAAVEPMHGSELAAYLPSDASPQAWGPRQRLAHDLNQGHGLAAADFLGLGRSQIAVGWRNPNPQGRVGVRLYVPDSAGSVWSAIPVDDNSMACEDLKAADLDGDQQPDLIAAGRATNNLKVYWNRAGRSKGD